MMSVDSGPDAKIEINAPISNSIVVGVNTGTITNIVQVAQTVTSLHQLRAQAPDFVGRTDELAQLCQALLPTGTSSKIAAICGMGGLGKTELALQVAHSLAEHYPDAQLMLSPQGAEAGSLRTPADALRDAIRAFEPQAILDDNLSALTARYRGHLGNKRCLVLLDDVSDDDTAQLFFPPAGSALLITSRSLLSLAGQGTVVALEGLHRDQARALLLDDAPALHNDPQLERILELCADLPLALRVAGAALRTNPLLTSEKYVQRLQDTTHRPSALRFAHMDVMAVLMSGYEALQSHSPELARRWLLLGVCPAPFETAAAASIWAEQDSDLLEEQLAQLVLCSMLSYDKAAQRFRMHNLLRDLAAIQRIPQDDQLAHLCHASHYLQIAREAQHLYERGNISALNGLKLFSANWEHIRTAAAWLASAGIAAADELLLAFTLESYELVFQYTLPAQQHLWFEATLRAARQCHNTSAEGRALGALGNSYAIQGETEQAFDYLTHSLQIARRNAEPLAIAVAANDLATVHLAREEHALAIPLLEEALQIYRTHGDQRHEGQTLVNLGAAQEAAKQPATALRSYLQSLELLKATGDLRTQVFVLGNLGLVHADNGKLKQAMTLLSRALAMAQQLGDQATALQLGWHLGLLQVRSGHPAQAQASLSAYVDYLRLIGDQDAESYAEQLRQLLS